MTNPSEPVGTPIQLTREEAIAIVDAGVEAAGQTCRGMEWVVKVRWLGGGCCLVADGILDTTFFIDSDARRRESAQTLGRD